MAGAAHPPAGQPPLHALGYARADLQKPRRNATRAVVALCFIVAIALLNLFEIGLEMWDYAQFNAADAGTLTVAQQQFLGNVYLVYMALFAIAFLGWLISYLLWQYRAVRNARILTGDSRSGPGWSVAYWFIPIANLFMPWLVLRDLWSRTVATASPVVGVFWLLWLGSGILSTVGTRMYEQAVELGDNDAARTSIYLTSCALVVSVLAWLLLAYIVRSVQQAQGPHEVAA